MKNIIPFSLVCGFWIAGCVEPPYRYEIHDTGEGSVRVETVPKTPEPVLPATPSPTPPPAAAAAAAPAPTTAPTVSDQQRIDALEAQVRALSEENQKLKQSAPTTAPAKE